MSAGATIWDGCLALVFLICGVNESGFCFGFSSALFAARQVGVGRPVFETYCFLQRSQKCF